MALGKSLEEIRALPMPEYLGWMRFYTLEPWGWHNQEYLFASIIAMLYNVNKGKKQKAKTPADFMRDIVKGIEREIHQLHEKKRFENMSREEKREYVIKQAQSLFGAKLIEKKQ